MENVWKTFGKRLANVWQTFGKRLENVTQTLGPRYENSMQTMNEQTLRKPFANPTKSLDKDQPLQTTTYVHNDLHVTSLATQRTFAPA